eukprot:8802668-Lingulodinium_polyedra.AAC.1
MVSKKETVQKKPGFSHVEWDYYTKHYGSLHTNGKLTEGHREYVHNGIRGVLVPDAPITRIEFRESLGAEIRARASGRAARCAEQT